MKKRIAFQLVLICLLFLASGLHVSAQFGFEVQNRESNIYVRSLQIEEVYATSFGYRVQYRRSNGRLAYADLPISWFGSAAAAGSIAYTHSPAVPFMNVVFIDGSVSHVNLFLPRNRMHNVYKAIDRSIDWREYFQGIETLELNY